jgi:hypothetical protein
MITYGNGPIDSKNAINDFKEVNREVTDVLKM